MGIRKRLLLLSIGISIPLTLAGLLMLWALWSESKRELTHSIEEQSQLAIFYEMRAVFWRTLFKDNIDRRLASFFG